VDKFNFNLGFNNIQAGPLNIQKTVISGNQTNNELTVDFLAYHDTEILAQISSKITGSREELRYHVVPGNLILSKSPWTIPDANEILIYDKKLVFNNFKMTKGNQVIEITDAFPEIPKDHVAIDFKNFNLSGFLSYLNPDDTLASGNLNGHFILEEPFEDTGIVADLDVQSLRVMD